ncbi:IS1-like element transposase [Serratia fonticola]|uniref:IS1-like element transposase n=1 Tax=Serratia fonticola TaxID=47917 RepID=UPI0035E44CF3
MVYDVTDIQHPVPNVILASSAQNLQLNFNYSSAKPDTLQAIVNMAMKGFGCLNTARVLSMNLNTVLWHLKKSPKQVAENIAPEAEIVICSEADEQLPYLQFKGNPHSMTVSANVLWPTSSA